MTGRTELDEGSEQVETNYHLLMGLSLAGSGDGLAVDWTGLSYKLPSTYGMFRISHVGITNICVV